MIKRGFTLIELMVVMMIIGVLVTLSAFGLQGARESARDAQRRSDLQTIKLALEQYRTDCNNYPATGGVFATEYPAFSAVAADCDGLTNNYISKSPNDPISGNSYYYAPATAAPVYSYIICAHLEGGSTTALTACNSAGASCGGVCNYAITNP